VQILHVMCRACSSSRCCSYYCTCDAATSVAFRPHPRDTGSPAAASASPCFLCERSASGPHASFARVSGTDSSVCTAHCMPPTWAKNSLVIRADQLRLNPSGLPGLPDRCTNCCSSAGMTTLQHLLSATGPFLRRCTQHRTAASKLVKLTEVGAVHSKAQRKQPLVRLPCPHVVSQQRHVGCVGHRSGSQHAQNTRYCQMSQISTGGCR
jgi:hypothetical protein